MNRILTFCVALSVVSISASAVFSQDNGTGTGTNTGTGTQGTGINQTQAGQTGGGGRQQAAPPNVAEGIQGQQAQVQEPPQIADIEVTDLRQQEFVGRRYNNYFHAYSQFNDSGIGGNTGANRQFGNTGQQQQPGGNIFGGANANNIGFVTRRSIRTRMRPSFSAPTVPISTRVSNFSDRLSRTTSLRGMTQNVKYVLEGRTGRLTGTVKSEEQKKLLERQVRLEPGVYKVVNELRVVN